MLMANLKTIADPEERDFWNARYWDALTERDQRLDGVFYYAVLSTGVYCRPSCGARQPKRENVLFFEKREGAERAGFRACRRCHPERDTQVDPQAEMVLKVCRHIDRHLDEPVRLEDLGREIGLSPFHLQRTFKAWLGIAPRAYADTRRLEALKSGLRAGQPVTRSMYDAGYGSSSRLYERAVSQLGMTPLRYRNQGAGETIRFTIAKSPVGSVLIAATERGVCSIQFGESRPKLEAALRETFPQARIEREDKELSQWLEALKEQMEGVFKRPLPLDIQATAFQRLVWEYLRKIPYGETASYQKVAAAIGKPKAARAVARACASNPVAIAIPCHRVVRKDGQAGGYRWGLERKAALLALEGT
jgi:AraC family transcriptional regulator, regulatory protein of adaptative response / methylated-DNA-[protein]-cysteine methyltransferase